MALLGDPRVLAVHERRPDVDARRGVARDLEQHVRAELQARAGHDLAPVDALERDVLAERARHDRMPLGPERLDLLQREQAHGALRPAVVLQVAMPIALETGRRHLGRGHGVLGHASRRDADLDDATVHGLTSLPPRRIIRWILASSTTSSRWFMTRWR